MQSFRTSLRRASSLSAGFAAVLSLSGCLFVTDTSRMNPDVFVRETMPVFYAPDGQQVPPSPAKVGPVRPEAKPPQTRNLYQTQFHQTYGLPVTNPLHKAMYGVMNDDGHTLPEIPLSRVDSRYLRQEVAYATTEKPGTIVIDTKEKFLYLVQPEGRAIRYGVGLGRDGYGWSGRGVIQYKAAWPRWTPPQEMVTRQPELRTVSANGGAAPGLNNPLGARALYIFKDGKDTLYRIHGTPDWQSVGKSVSSGCVRMFNQDVIDLFDRVGAKASIVVL